MKEINEALLSSLLRPIKKDAHKGGNGTLNIIAGSMRFRGAADLAVSGALRTGTGIVRLIAPESVVQTVAVRHPSCTFLPITGALEAQNAVYTHRDETFLVGCGLGKSGDTAKKVASVLFSVKKAVLDADALNVIAESPELQSRITGAIITPHVGEFSRLCGLGTDEIKRSPERLALDYAEKHGVTVVLKDANTVIACENGNTYLSKCASEGLSKGGSGDVLAGIIAGIYAQGYQAEESAVIGVAVHALASQKCALEKGIRSMLPSDLEYYICKLFSELGH